jgi:hypothetical protein
VSFSSSGTEAGESAGAGASAAAGVAPGGLGAVGTGSDFCLSSTFSFCSFSSPSSSSMTLLARSRSMNAEISCAVMSAESSFSSSSESYRAAKLFEAEVGCGRGSTEE